MAKFSRKEQYEWLGFNDLKLRLILVPILSYFFPIIVMGVTPTDNWPLYLQSFVVSLLHIVLYWEFDRYIVIILRKKYRRISEYKKRLIIQTTVIVFTTVLFCFMSEFIQLCFNQVMGKLKISLNVYIIASLVITSIIVSIYEARFAFEKYKSGLIKNEELQKENTRAQLESLKNQVNPHFFFNSINTLISVIPEDPTTAVKFAENLSQVYRCILQMKDKEIISLAEEFSCISAYKYLLKIRFSEQVTFIGDELMQEIDDKFIVPMSVQMLVENAIKHNVVSHNHPLEIRFEMTNDFLVVSNKRSPKKTAEFSTKIGLRNVDKRYELLADKSIVVEESMECFRVYLPILQIGEVK
jgi:two-component system, LytTR family, sensor kinase